MIGVLVSFTYDDDFDRTRCEHIAHEAQAMFRGMPDLRFKFFTVDHDRRRATNFYVWESRATAEKFFSDELRSRVTQLYGVAPDIAFVDVVEMVDNSAAAATPV